MVTTIAIVMIATVDVLNPASLPLPVDGKVVTAPSPWLLLSAVLPPVDPSGTAWEEPATICTTADTLVPFSVALMVADVVSATGAVPISNTAVVSPSSTRTLVATPADGLSLTNMTVVPPTGAGADIVTVAVVESPPVTESEAMVTPMTDGPAAGSGVGKVSPPAVGLTVASSEGILVGMPVGRGMAVGAIGAVGRGVVLVVQPVMTPSGSVLSETVFSPGPGSIVFEPSLPVRVSFPSLP